MRARYNFKYSLIYTSIFVLGFVVFTSIVLGVLITSIVEKDYLNVGEEWYDVIFEIGIGILLPIFLLTLGLLSFFRLKYAFTRIEFNFDEKCINWKRFNRIKKIRFKDVLFTKDDSFNGVLRITNDYYCISIPKELNDYQYLYHLLFENGLIKEKVNFDNLKTTLGFQKYFFLILFIGFGFFPLLGLFPLINEFDGSTNSILGIVLIPFIGLGMIFMALWLAFTYKFTKDGVIRMNLFGKWVIKYSNIKEIDYDPFQRSLTLHLIKDKYRRLRKWNGQKGIVLMEPGNISIEQMYYEIKENIKKIEF